MSNPLSALLQKTMRLTARNPQKIVHYFNIDLAFIQRKSIMFCLITGITTLTVSVVFGIQILLFLPLLVMGVFVAYANYPCMRYNRIMSTITEHADLIYNELATVKSYSNSIIEAIRFIATGKYPYISSELLVTINKIELGAVPEKEIAQFLQRYPIPILIEGWSLFLDNQAITDRNLDVTQELAQQLAFNRFEEQTTQLETRVMLFVGLSLFGIPIYQMTSSISNWGLMSTVMLPLLLFCLFLLEGILFNRLKISRLSNEITYVNKGG